MSVSYRACTLIGVKVPVEKLFTTETILHKIHPYPEGAVFCPICGARVIEIVNKMPVYNTDEEQIGTFSVLIMNDREENSFVGEIQRVSNWHDITWKKMESLPDFTQLKEELEKVLTPYGLWDEEAFGVYTIMDWA